MLYGLDIETYGRNGWLLPSRLISVAVVGKGYVNYELLCHPTLPSWVSDEVRGEDPLPDWLRKILLDWTHTIVCHNAMFDIGFLESRLGCAVRCGIHCTLVQASLIDAAESNDLGTVSATFLGKGTKKLEINVAKLWKEEPSRIKAYNVHDARLAFRLQDKLGAVLKKDPPLLRLYEEQRERLMVNLLGAHREGICIDVKEAEKRASRATKKIGRIEKMIRSLASTKGVTWTRTTKGQDIEADFDNPGSAKQLASLLAACKVRLVDKTEKGQPSTSVLALKRARRRARKGSEAFRLLDGIIEMRKLAKQRSAFLLPLTGDILGSDDKVHPMFHVGRGVDEVAAKGRGKVYTFGTMTGRLSSAYPNIQQIPNGPDVKDLFVPSKGWMLGEVDYSQVELRVAAYLSHDPRLVAVFASGQDMHSMILSQMTGAKYEDIVRWKDEKLEWKEKRISAKRVVFGGLLYGAWVDTIAETIERDLDKDVSRSWVEKLLRRLRQIHKGYFSWEKGVRLLLAEEGCVTAPFGMTRWLEKPGGARIPRGTPLWSRAERQAVNFLIQNTAAEITYEAINLLCSEMDSRRWRFLTTVHDQVLFEHKGRFGPKDRTKMTRLMTDCVKERMIHLGVEDADDLTLEVEIEANKPSWGQKGN